MNASEVNERVAAAKLSHLTYRPTADGDPVEVSLRAAQRVFFEDAVPVREPMAYQGQWSKPGYYVMATTGQLVSYESRFEMAHLMLLDRDQSVTDVAPQPFRLHWKEPGGNARRHVPDFFVRRRDGSGEVIDVKGSLRAARSANALVFGVTARACHDMGFSFRVATEINPVVLENHRWLAAYRFVTDRVADLGPYVLDAVQQDQALGSVVSTAATASGAHPSQVKAVTFHLVWSGLLHCDLTQPLTRHTVISNYAGVASHVA